MTAQDAMPHGPLARPHALGWPTKLIGGVAALKTLIGLVLVTPLAPAVIDRGLLGRQAAFHGLPFLIPGLILLLANGRQCRTASLGIALILFGSRYVSAAVGLLAGPLPMLRILVDVSPVLFLPYYLGRFLLEFPQPRVTTRARWLHVATRIAAGFGLVEFVAVSSRGLTGGWTTPPFIYELLAGRADSRIIPLAMFGLTLLILVLSVQRLRGLLPDDRRRHQRLFIGWIMLIAPLAFWLTQLAFFSRAVGNTVVPNGPWRIVNLILTVVLLLAPSVITYRALAGRSWQMREVLRRSVHTALDIRWLLPLAAVPLMIVAGIAYTRQDQPVAAVFSRATIAWLLVSGAAAALLLQRRRLLSAFDWWFFREHYDADQMLFDLTHAFRRSRGIDELVAHLTSGIDRALGPYRVVVLVRDESATQFVPLFGSAEPLPASALLIDLLSKGDGVLDTPLTGGTSPLRWLPRDERYWLAECGARLIVPLKASDGALHALVTIGDRRSGREYSAGDRRWLIALAAAATLTIDANSKTATDPDSPADTWQVGLVQRHARALECGACGHIDDAAVARCPECGSAVAPAFVPRVLFGKFRFEQRIGRGGMGVVYRATDLALERFVAVKMLPGATPEYSELLRLEARSMAAVTHRHLAVVYGVEGWRGQPLLVCEYMERGTLSDRLLKGPMATDDVLTLGVALADALAVLHTKHLLHRDIKPSNIGFDHAGVPKLLDFGLAHLLSTSTRLPEDLRPRERAGGTPLYMSPEALAGQEPARSFDLWSLHVLLYEAIAGRHPFRRETTDETVRAITRDTVPPLAPAPGVSPDRSVRLASYFAGARGRTADKRPLSATQAAAELRGLMT
jgi:hypothetical protein